MLVLELFTALVCSDVARAPSFSSSSPPLQALLRLCVRYWASLLRLRAPPSLLHRARFPCLTESCVHSVSPFFRCRGREDKHNAHRVECTCGTHVHPRPAPPLGRCVDVYDTRAYTKVPVTTPTSCLPPLPRRTPWCHRFFFDLTILFGFLLVCSARGDPEALFLWTLPLSSIWAPGCYISCV